MVCAAIFVIRSGFEFCTLLVLCGVILVCCLFCDLFVVGCGYCSCLMLVDCLSLLVCDVLIVVCFILFEMFCNAIRLEV